MAELLSWMQEASKEQLIAYIEELRESYIEQLRKYVWYGRGGEDCECEDCQKLRSVLHRSTPPEVKP